MDIKHLYYLSRGVSALEFIRYIKANDIEDYFLNYTEFIMDRKGKLYFYMPSHNEKIKHLCSIQHDFDLYKIEPIYSPLEYAVSRFGYIALWYSYIICPGYKNYEMYKMYDPDNLNRYSIPEITKMQQRSINILRNSGYLSKNVEMCKTDEYQRGLLRNNMIEK